MGEHAPVEKDLLQALVRLMLYWSSASTQSMFADQANVDLDPTDMQAIYILGSLGGAGQSQIADEMHLSRPTTSKLVARLLKAGLIERQANPQDGRAVFVRLSPQGVDVYTRLVQAGENAVRAGLASWDATDAHALSTSVTRFVTDLLEGTRPGERSSSEQK